MQKTVPIIFGVAFAAILLWAIFTFKFVSWDFRNNLWAPARLVLAVPICLQYQPAGCQQQRGLVPAGHRAVFAARPAP